LEQAGQAAPVAWKRHLYMMMALTTCNFVQYSAARFALILYAIHLQASPLVIGMLIGLNSLIPALSSVHMGRWLDRTRNLRSPMIGACVVMAIGVLLPFFWEGIPALFVFCLVVGSSSNIFRIASQQMIGRYGLPENRASNYTTMAQGFAMGNLIAPLMTGFAIDHIGFSYTFLLLTFLVVPPVVVLAMRWVYLPMPEIRKASVDAVKGEKSSTWDLLKIPALRRILIANVALTSAWDIFTFAWPLHGSQLQFSASQIGMVAGIFFSGTFVVRSLSGLLLKRYSQWRLIIISMTSASTLYLVFPFMTGFMVLSLLAFLLGLLLGLLQPMSMALCYDESPEDRKGEVIGLRLTLIFSLHITIPLLAGAMGSTVGMLPVWFAASGMLLTGSWLSRRQWSRKG
jgi:MFS family permease